MRRRAARAARRGSLLDPRNARRVQDPISFRSVAHVHGALRAALGCSRGRSTRDLNGSETTPWFWPTRGRSCRLGTSRRRHWRSRSTRWRSRSARRQASRRNAHSGCSRSSLTELPENLSPHGAERSGYAPLVKTAQALLTDLRHLAAPLTIDPQVGAALVEDTRATPRRRPAARRRCSSGFVTCSRSRRWWRQAVDLAAPGTIWPRAGGLASRRPIARLPTRRGPVIGQRHRTCGSRGVRRPYPRGTARGGRDRDAQATVARATTAAVCRRTGAPGCSGANRFSS